MSTAEQRPPRVQWDGTISLNTIVMVLAIVGALMQATDRMAEARADAAVIRSEMKGLNTADVELRAQRERDRTELRAEINEINRKLDRLLESRPGRAAPN